MAVVQHSRYANGTVSTFNHPTKGPVVCLDNYIVGPLALSDVFSYTVTDGETYGSIANKFYGDDTKWWVIAQANSGIDALFFPLTIPMGTVIQVPTPQVASQV